MMKDFSEAYAVWFCDIWGVVHDGVKPFATTVDTLKRHRARGGRVILVTNSPRSNLGVEKQLLEIGVDPESHDRIVTSGDVTQVLMRLHGGEGVYHVGAARDLSIYEGTGVTRVDHGVGAHLAGHGQAERPPGPRRVALRSHRIAVAALQDQRGIAL